jgi:hypothetical protein
MSIQDPITRLLVKEIGDNMHPGKGDEMASCGIPFIPCKWNGYHPDSLVKGMHTNMLPDFTWVGAQRMQVGDEFRLVSIPQSAVYRKFDHSVGMTRVLIPDDPDGKNRARLAKMQEMVKSKAIKVAEYETLHVPSSNRSVIEALSDADVDDLLAKLTAAAAQRQQKPAAPTPEVTTEAEAPLETPEAVQKSRKFRDN